jgi:hypothetical protein
MGPSGGIGSCCRRSRTAFASHSRCWEYWSVFELTPPSAGLEAGRCRFRGEGGRIRIRDQPHAPSTTQRRMVLRSWMNTPCAGLKQVRRVEKPSNGMPRICWQTIFICGKLQWYGKPLKQLRLLSRQADIRRVTDASSVNLSRCRARSGRPRAIINHITRAVAPDEASKSCTSRGRSNSRSSGQRYQFRAADKCP